MDAFVRMFNHAYSDRNKREIFGAPSSPLALPPRTCCRKCEYVHNTHTTHTHTQASDPKGNYKDSAVVSLELTREGLGYLGHVRGGGKDELAENVLAPHPPLYLFISVFLPIFGVLKLKTVSHKFLSPSLPPSYLLPSPLAHACSLTHTSPCF